MTLKSFGPKTKPQGSEPLNDDDPLLAAVEDEEEDEEELDADGPKTRSQEAAKYRVRAKNAETRVAQLEARVAELEGSAGNEELKAENLELRVANAFLEEAAGKFTDLGAAYKLLDQALINVSGEGEVTGMHAAVSTVATRYPFLTQDEKQPKTQPDNYGPSGSPFNGAKSAKDGLDMAALSKKFPSLQRRIRCKNASLIWLHPERKMML